MLPKVPMPYAVRFGAATLLTISLATPVFADAALDGVKAEVTNVVREISTAQKDASQYSGGLVKVLIEARIETLKLTKSILENRIAAEEGGATVKIVVPATRPDPDRARTILADIQTQMKKVSEAESEANSSGGLVQALAVSRVQTEKLTLAQLRAAWYQAEYGIEIPTSASPTGPAPSGRNSNPSGEAGVQTDAVAWADKSHPEINYSSQIFAQLNKQAAVISGWWGILTSKAAVDDSKKIVALNVSQYSDTGFGSSPTLVVQCVEGTTAVVYNADSYLLTDFNSDSVPVTYRIDENPAVRARWSKLTSSKGAGLFSAAGEGFIRKIYKAHHLFVRITDNNGQDHDATFNLAGGKKAYDAAAAACGFSTLSLTTDDYRAIQTLLNAAGYSAGTPDGQWGPGSQAALKQFQSANGINATGAPDRATLSKLGYQF